MLHSERRENLGFRRAEVFLTRRGREEKSRLCASVNAKVRDLDHSCRAAEISIHADIMVVLRAFVKPIRSIHVRMFTRMENNAWKSSQH
jgi:hypothetical protein